MFIDLEGFCLSEVAGDIGSPSWLERYLDDPGSLSIPPAKHIGYPEPRMSCCGGERFLR